jgi:DNA-binding SARP family transcriptional activator
LVAADPFDEAHRLRQARTLYRAGRAKDALDALRGFRDELADELGLDPSPDLAALEQAILRHDPGLDGARRVHGYLIGERLGRGASPGRSGSGTDA